ncbi:MAG: hypothetical protein VX250_03450 [Planctomycetota bacterium]|nr:hypothetical protein [Planctomycetota bacterium]
MTENAGIRLDQYLETKGALPGPQLVRMAWQLAQVMGSESESETGSRAPVLHVGRILIAANGKIDVTPSDETDLGLPIVASFPHHASPEEINGEGGDFRSSLYSLGCTLFEIATGATPYFGDSSKEVLKAHLNEDVPDPVDRGAKISAELSRVIQELLRKNPEQRIQSVPELLRRLKICIGIEDGPKTAPTGEEGSPEVPKDSDGEKKKRKKLASSGFKRPSKTEASKDTEKPAEKKTGKIGARPARKTPSFSKKKSGDQSATSRTGRDSKKSFSFSKTKSSGAKKGLAGASADRFASAPGSRLSGKLIDRGDEGDIFEDTFEEDEQMGYSVVRKKSKPFMMAGGGLGMILAILVIFTSQKSSKNQVRLVQERNERTAAKQLREIKTAWSTKYETQRKSVEDYLAKQTNRFNSGLSPSVIEGALEGQLETSFFNKPGAVLLAVLYAKVHVRAEEERAARKEVELGREGNFDSFVTSFNKLYEQGLWAPAMDKIRDAEIEYKASKETEIDELYFKAEKAMIEQWESDELKIKDLASEGEPQKAIRIAEGARLYGDNAIRKDAIAYIESIRAQTSVSSDSGETEEEPAEEPEEGGVPDDIDSELEDLEDQDDSR